MPNYWAWIAGEKTNIRVSPTGELLSAVEIGGVIVEAPGVNTETDVLNTLTLNPSTTTNFPFSNVTTGYGYMVTNDGNVTITYNVGSKGAMDLLSDETIQEDMVKFTSLQMVNASSTSCDIRARVSGV